MNHLHGDAPADLGARFAAALKTVNGRQVSADALFETLKLEALDWGMDHDVDTQVVETDHSALATETTDKSA